MNLVFMTAPPRWIHSEARKPRPAGLRWRQAGAPGGCHPAPRRAGPLDAAGAMTDNFRQVHDQEVDRPGRARMSKRCGKRSTGCASRSTELRASRKRLVLAADADRRSIERDLHDGVQQHLVALAVNLQLARGLVDADPAAAKALLEEMGRDVQQALDETARARAADLPAAARGGRPRRGAALGGDRAGDPCLRRRRGGRELPARVRGDGLPVLSRGARARRRRGAGDDRRCGTRTERSPSSSSRTAPLRRRDSTGCATASRRSAAG